MPSVSLLWIILCSISAFVFFQPKFLDPSFFYYRLLYLFYIIHLLIGIPYGLLFSPRYFPQINTYLSSTYNMYYIVVTAFLYHFEDTLQMAILIEPKNFSSSDFGSSILGRILLGFTSFFLSTFLPLFVGVAFNLISVYQYKSLFETTRSCIQ